MSRVQVNIERLVLHGFEPAAARTLAQALETQLAEALSHPAARAEWVESRSVSALRLGRIPLEAGTAGARKFGRHAANAIARGLKP
jgi:hypothetical protein